MSNSGPTAVKIPFEQLQELSAEVWGDSVYGRIAVGWVEYSYESWPKGGIEVYRDEGGYNFSYEANHQVLEPNLIIDSVRRAAPDFPYALRLKPLENKKVIAKQQPKAIEPGEWASEVDDIINGAPMWRPSDDMHTDHQSPANEPPAFKIEKTGFSDVRLRNYLQTRKLDEHVFRGSFGKALDVLNVAAGLARPRDLGISHTDEPFIAYSEFRERIFTAPPEVYKRRQSIIERVRDTARCHARIGKVSDVGQIILEGNVCIASGAAFTYDLVAFSSLAHTLPATWRKENEATIFLRQHFGSPH